MNETQKERNISINVRGKMDFVFCTVFLFFLS